MGSVLIDDLTTPVGTKGIVKEIRVAAAGRKNVLGHVLDRDVLEPQG
jgi:hypothetical protein